MCKTDFSKTNDFPSRLTCRLFTALLSTFIGILIATIPAHADLLSTTTSTLDDLTGTNVVGLLDSTSQEMQSSDGANEFIRVEQNDARVTYSGSWYTDDGPSHSQGTAALSMNAGAQATFSFTGSAVRWIGLRDEWSGKANVYIDGIYRATVDTYRLGSESQAVLFEANNLAAAHHTLTIEVTGNRNILSLGSWIWIDAFEYNPRFEQDNPAVSFSGSWYRSNTSEAFSGGDSALSPEARATATFTFTGSAVSWIGYQDEWSGIADVFLDGVHQRTIDTYSSPSRSQVVQFSATGLSASTTHTLTIEVTGMHNASAQAAWVWVDAFELVGGDAQEPPADTTAPSVAMTAPADGATVSGTIPVTANADDDTAVAGVQLHLDGAPLGSEDTIAPYEIAWDTTSVADGTYTLSATARDAANNQATSSTITVTVDNEPPADTTPPSVAVTSPSDGATVSGSVSVTADATDNVGVAGVQFFLDGAPLGAEDSTTPYGVTWDTTAYADGSYTLTATARDDAGNATTSVPVSVTVANDVPTETVRIEETNSAVSYAGSWDTGNTARAWSGGTASLSTEAGAQASLTFTGTQASWIGFRGPQVGIANVYIDGTFVAEVDGYAEAEEVSAVMFTTPELADGTHTLAIESTGASNPSSSAAFVVVDAFDIVGSAGDGSGDGGSGGGDTVRHEEDDPAISYAGTWYDSIFEPHSGGMAKKSFEADSTASFTFSGTQVTLIGYRDPNTGIANIYIDDTLVAEIDTYSPDHDPQAPVFTSAVLPAGTHSIRVEVTGRYNPSGNAAWIAVDTFDVTP